MLQYRGLHNTSSTNTPASLSAGTNNRYYYSRGPPCFGNGLGISAPSPNSNGPLALCSNQLSSRASVVGYGASNVSSIQSGAFHTASRAMSTSLLIGGRQSAIQQLGSVEEIVSSGWATKTAAVIVAAAAAGSIWVNPIDRLRGSGGGGGGGGGEPNPGGGGGQFEHKFDSYAKDEEDDKTKVSVGVTAAAKPYEVSSFDQSSFN